MKLETKPETANLDSLMQKLPGSETRITGDTGKAKVFPLRPTKRLSKKPAYKIKNRDSQEAESDFSSLASKLEEKIGRIEAEINDSIQILEQNLHKALKNKKLNKEEKNIHVELEQLSEQIESRIKKSLQVVSLKIEAGKTAEKDRLDAIKRLSSQLTKMLSFDFYREVIQRLGTTEFEQEVDPFGMDHAFVERIKPIFDYLYYQYWRVHTTGIDHIPHEGRALIVANHSGTVPYDGAMIKCAILNEHPLRKDARFLVEDFVYHMPMLGSLMYRIGGVRACPENAEFLLNSEHLVVVFPEGVKGIGKFFRDRYKLQRFGRGGFIRLCMKTKSPLIPVGVVGAEEIHPILFKSNTLAKTIGLPYLPITPTFPLLGPLGIIPFPTKWSIHFGSPVLLGHYPESAMEDDLLIHKLSEKVRTEIQGIIMQLLKKRRSVWFG